MLLLPEREVAFIHINRTGGTSVVMAMMIDIGMFRSGKSIPELLKACKQHSDIHNIPHTWHRKAYRVKPLLGKKWDKWFTFSVVRNPWDKMVSVFHKRKFLLGRKELRHLSFTKWLKRVDELTPVRFSSHQYDWLSDANGNIMVDYVGRFEDLAGSWAHVCDVTGMASDLPHANASKHKKYQSYYDKQAERIVAKRFSKDIEHFGYTF
jgi:hypothetical protein